MKDTGQEQAAGAGGEGSTDCADYADRERCHRFFVFLFFSTCAICGWSFGTVFALKSIELHQAREMMLKQIIVGVCRTVEVQVDDPEGNTRG
jgi:hypothetical protein